MNDPAPAGLRELPPVNEVLDLPAIAPLIAECGRETVRDWAREAATDLRRQISAGALNGACSRQELAQQIVQSIRQRADDHALLQFGMAINATGVVLHTSLGRAPLCAAAVDAISQAAAACSLEVDLASGERRARGHQLQPAWRRLTGAEAALVVNNNAAATVLALDALCRGREVILSRGQLIEIGGSFRLPEIFAQSGAILREVGTTNRTTLADYERAIGPDTAAILRVHPSNYRVVGFADSPEIADLVPLARQHGLACIDDIGSGCLVDTTRFGLPEEPTFQQSLAAGADLVLGSGDKLLGGPQCGILLGNSALIQRLSAHPLARALRIDKLTLAALSATLDAYLRGAAEREIPTLSLLAAPQAELLARAHRIHDSCVAGGASGASVTAHSGIEITMEIALDTALVGGGSLPGAALATAVLRIAHLHLTADDLARRLRLGTPHVFPRIHEGAVVLDLRSVLPGDDEKIVAAIRNLGESGR
jgi:L-seryl-tRNA(Ser) seleniumtransferase